MKTKGGSMARETKKSSRLAQMRGVVARTARKLTARFHREKAEERTQPIGGRSMDTPMTGTGPTGMTSSETTPMKSTTGGICPECGQPLGGNRGLEQFLGKLGISEEMIDNLRTQMQNVDIDEYLNTA